MNFSVYNTESLNNFPDSGIYSTYYSHLDGITPTNTNSYSIATDDQYIYYPSLQYTYISKNIQTIAVLNTNGDIISQIKPTISLGATIIYIDNDYVYFYTQGLTYKSNANDQSRNLYRFNKNTYKIDPNFCLGGWNGYLPFSIKYYDNKYYFGSISNSLTNQIYPNLDDKSDAGIFIIKNNKNISNLKTLTATFNKIKIKDENVYICGTTAHSRATRIYSKIFRINKNGQIDKNFYPYIERSNSTNAGAAGSVSSNVYDFDFDNEGIYIGGHFLTVNGDVRTGLAKIDYSGNIISGFNTNLTQSVNSTDLVRAVVTSGSGVFIGGSLNYSGDTTKSRLLKLNNDGTLNTQFTGYQAMSTNTVYNLLLSGNSLYAGGNFSSPGGTYGAGVIKFDANNGSVDPNFNVEFANATTTDMKISGNNLYVSTSAPYVWSNNNGGLVTRTGVFKVNASNGEPDANFQIDFNTSAGSLYSVTNMLIKGNELHIVGNFTGINNYTLNGYAVVDTVSGKLLNTIDKFSYGLSNVIGHRAINYNPNNDTIIIAGSSTFPFGTGYNFNYDSRINVFDNNFNILTGIQFVASGMNNSYSMLYGAQNTNSILFNNNTGYIPIADTNNVFNSRVNIYNLDNGNIIDNNSLFYLSGNNIFNSIVKYNNDLYFGGGFSQVYSNGFTGTRAGVVKTNINGVIDSSFNLNLTGTSSSLVSNLKIIDNNLFIIGNTALTGASGIRVNNFVKYNLLTNSIDTGFNNFLTTGQTNIKDVHNDSRNNLYFVMNYSNFVEYTGIGGYNDNSGHLFKFSSGSYTPDLNFANKYFWLTENISINNDKIYAPLRNTQKISGSNIYKINKKTREILPHKVFLNGSFIYDIYGNNNSIYICGSFTGINNVPQTGFAKLNKSDLSIDSNFSLNPTSNTTIVKILEKDNHLYFAGPFSGVIQSGTTTLTSGLCRISKTNDAVDTSFQINQSGLSLPATLDASISGNYIYILNLSAPLLRIIDINAKQLQFTGTVTAISTSASAMYGITTTPNNLFICGTAATKTDSRLVGSRGRNVFMAGFNSGEIIPPYSSWNNQANSNFLAARYVPMNNTVAISPSTPSIIINNTSNSNTTSLAFFDADKMYIKNTRNTTYSVSLPSNYTPPRLYSPNNYETYILYNNYLTANPEDNITWIHNNGLTRGIIKYDAIKERYDIII